MYEPNQASFDKLNQLKDINTQRIAQKIDITVGVALHCVVHTFPIKIHT